MYDTGVNALQQGYCIEANLACHDPSEKPAWTTRWGRLLPCLCRCTSVPDELQWPERWQCARV